MNADFEAWSFRSTRSFQSAFLFTLIATFGLTLFSCNEKRNEAEILNFQETAKSILANATPTAGEKLAVIETPIEKIPMVFEEPILKEFVWENAEYFDYKEIEKEDIHLEKEYYSYGGAMVSTHVYNDYLVATVNTTEEYDRDGNLIPTEFSSIAFPNPTADNSTIEIKVPTTGEFQIDLYDMNGKRQSEIYSGSIERGTFRQAIEMNDLPPGMYLVTILSKEYKETVRVSKI